MVFFLDKNQLTFFFSIICTFFKQFLSGALERVLDTRISISWLWKFFDILVFRISKHRVEYLQTFWGNLITLKIRNSVLSCAPTSHVFVCRSSWKTIVKFVTHVTLWELIFFSACPGFHVRAQKHEEKNCWSQLLPWYILLTPLRRAVAGCLRKETHIERQIL